MMESLGTPGQRVPFLKVWTGTFYKESVSWSWDVVLFMILKKKKKKEKEKKSTRMLGEGEGVCTTFLTGKVADLM